MSDQQNTDFDLSSAIEKIQEMMSNDEGQSQLNSIISAFTAGTEEKSESAKGGAGFPDFDGIDQIDMMIKLGNILSAMKSESGGKSEALLYAIKPYLRKSRQEKTDSAVKIMGMVRVMNVLKDSGIGFEL